MNNSCTNVTHPPVVVVVTWMPEDATKIGLTITYSLILLSGLLGNVLFCFVLYRNKSLQTATNCYLCSMSVSDLTVLLFGYPFEIFSIWSDEDKFTNRTYHTFHSFMLETSTNATLLTIAVFTAERYIGICHPMKSHLMPQLGRVSKFLLILWIVSVVWALIVVGCGDLWKGGHDVISSVVLVSFVIFFALPMAGIVVSYLLIAVELKKTQKMLAIHTPLKRIVRGHPSSSGSSHVQIQARNRDVIQILVAVVVAFFLCYSPFQVQRLISVLGDSKNTLTLKIFQVMTHISGISLYLSTCVNPFLYHMSRRFRKAVKKTFGCRRMDRNSTTRRLHSKFRWTSQSQSYLTSTITRLSQIPSTTQEPSDQMKKRSSSLDLLNTSTPIADETVIRSNSFMHKFVKMTHFISSSSVPLVGLITNPRRPLEIEEKIDGKVVV